MTVQDSSPIERYLAACDFNGELYDGLARRERRYEFDHIRELHNQFMEKARQEEPDSTIHLIIDARVNPLVDMMKTICNFANMAMLPEEEHRKFMEVS